jgi:hypothetical protein
LFIRKLGSNTVVMLRTVFAAWRLAASQDAVNRRAQAAIAIVVREHYPWFSAWGLEALYAANDLYNRRQLWHWRILLPTVFELWKRLYLQEAYGYPMRC